MVYIKSKNGKPLMPTEDHAKVRCLLKAGKAKVVKLVPFTIRLLGASHCYRQPVAAGIDAGSKHVGLSASTAKKELFSAELRPRNDVVGLMSDRREFRRRRRAGLRHRKPRFDNRVHSKHKGWLAPSVEVKIWNHIQGIRLMADILPITAIVVEDAEFDLQRIKAMEDGRPLPEGRDYQQGEQLGHYNVRQYVLWRDGYTCQCCGAHGTDRKPVKLHVHHIESRKTGGDAPDNLVTLCEACHKAYHGKKIDLPIKKRRRKPTRDMAFMGIMRKTLFSRLKAMFPEVEIKETYGYVTKYWREKLGLAKTHTTDAFVIAGNFDAGRIEEQMLIIPKRQHNRKIHKATVGKGGMRKLNQTPKYVHGFQLFDRVLCNGEEGFIFGRRASGGFDIRKLDGTRINANISYKKLRLLEKRKPFLVAYA